MFRIILGIFLVLHGLVHLLYFGQSARYFELQPGMAWPDGSWALTRLLGDAGTRGVANVTLILAALALTTGGAGLLLKQDWWRLLVLVAAVFSSLIYLLLWDGGWQHLDNKGGVGILINLGILALGIWWRGI
jgi:hypothetical protein